MTDNLPELQIRLDHLSDEISKLYDEAECAFSESVALAIECGKKLTEAKALVPHGGWIPWVEESTPFGTRQAQKLMRIASGEEKLLELIADPNANYGSHLTINEASKALADDKKPEQASQEPEQPEPEQPSNLDQFEGQEPPEQPETNPDHGKANVGQSSGNNEHNTPGYIIEAARATLGHIDLDPASNKAGQKIVKAKVYYTEKNNGLSKKWKGRVWMNPPYARGLIDDFVGKFIDHWREGDIKAGIILVNTSNGVSWFNRLLDETAYYGLCLKRTAFINEDGEEQKSPPYSNFLFYFGDEPETFYRNFSDIILPVKKVEL